MKTKLLTVANVDFNNEEEAKRFREEQLLILAERKKQIVAGLKERGQLTPDGRWVFQQPLPDDIAPGSLTDFKH